MPDNEELGPPGGERPARDEPGAFDAFRAWRAQEQEGNEPYAQPVPTPPGDGRGSGRLRSTAVLAGAVVLVAGLVFGVYEGTKPSSSGPAAASPAATASPSPSAGASKSAKNGRAAIARLTVTSVGADSFTAAAANGTTVSVQITNTTKFGTAARPFARSQLVPGAVVYARLRREADGTVVATVIASATAGKGSATASPTAAESANAGA